MEIMISLLTENRKFSKALRRLDEITNIEEKLKDVKLSNEKFDEVHIFFVDESVNYSKETPNKLGVLQIDVGYDDSLSFSPADDNKLIKEMKKQIIFAINESTLKDVNKNNILKVINQTGAE